MVFFIVQLCIAVIVLFVLNAKNQSGLVLLKREVALLKKQLELLHPEGAIQPEQPTQQMRPAPQVYQVPPAPPVPPAPQAYQAPPAQPVRPVTQAYQAPQVSPAQQFAPAPFIQSAPIVQEAAFADGLPVNSSESNTSRMPSNETETKVQVTKSNLFSIESIISKLGIFLFLIGVGYLYKLAYDNGYITETLAIVFGEVVGIGIIGLGAYVQKKQRPVLSQVLFGGGIATNYIVTYVAYNNYQLLSGFGAMFVFVMITIAAFFIAVTINRSTIAVVAVLGGLLTPFMVDIEYLGFFGVGIYLLVLAFGAMSIYMLKQWRSLQLSTIGGVYAVTLLLLLNGSFSTDESIQFSILILAFYFLFNGIDYFFFYKGVKTDCLSDFTPMLFILLPAVTILHWIVLLDFSEKQWSLVSLICMLVYIGGYVLLVQKKGFLPVTDILISYVGLFGMAAVILFFGGEVRIVVIIAMSLMFYFLSIQTKHRYLHILGHLIFAIGYLWAIVEYGIAVDEGFSIISVSVQGIILLLMTVGAWLQKGIVKKILGTISIELYGLAVLFRLTSEIGQNSEPIAVIMLTIGAFLWLLWLLNDKLQLVSWLSIAIIGMLPFLLQLLTNVAYYEDGIVPVSVIILSVAYCLNLYGLAVIMMRHSMPKLSLSMKLGAYVMLIMNTLFHMQIVTDHFGYGLCLVGAFLLLLPYIEKNQEQSIQLFISVLNGGFVIGLILYGLLKSSSDSLDFVVLAVDIAMLVILYFVLKKLPIPESMQFSIHIFTYLLLIYQNLKEIDNGTITLLWAAYGIIALFMHVYHRKKSNYYISLGLIIFVAVKFVVVDLSYVEPVYKAITAMVFGIALLILSYFIQPLLARDQEINDKRE